MREVIDQTINQLSDATGDRRQHPLYQAIAAAIQDSPDDTRDLESFAQKPERYEAVLRDILKQRLSQNPALLAKLQSLLGTTATPAASVTHEVKVSDNARVGTAIAGDLNGNLTIGSMIFGDSKVINAADPARDDRPQGRISPTPSGPPAAAKGGVLDATLSADGIHFSYGHALLIGVGDYVNWWLSTPATANDANLLAKLLCDPAAAAYPADQVTLLSGQQATCANILKALDDFATQVAQTPNATALLFFAGHGVDRDGQYYLLAHDYNKDQLATTSIDTATFSAKVDAIAKGSQKQLVLLNCCHSGGVSAGVLDDVDQSEVPLAAPKSFYAPLVEGSGSVVISSSKPAERSGAQSSNNDQATVFGAQLLDALSGKAPGQGAAVGVFELFSYLSRSIPTDAHRIIDPATKQPLEQHPLIYARQVDQDFPVTLRSGKPAGTLDVSLGDRINALAQIEIRLAEYDSEAQAPPDLVAERDQLLAQMG